MDELISRQAALDAIHEDADWLAAQGSDWQVERMERDKSILKSLPTVQPKTATACDSLCKYYDNDKGCLFFYQGSGRQCDMPCYTSVVKARWEPVKSNPRMIHCTNCKGSWWGKEFKERFKFCPECAADMRGETE